MRRQHRNGGRSIMNATNVLETCLYVDDLSRAERFYVKDGWAPDGTQRTDTVWGVQVNDQRFRRTL